MAKRYIGLGAGGHAKVVRAAIEASGDSVGGWVVAPADLSDAVDVLGTDDDLPGLAASGWEFAFVAIGMVRASGARARLMKRAVDAGFELPPIVHPRAIVAPSARIEAGAQVLAGAIVNPDAVIGAGSIVNTGAIVEHDTVVGPYAHVAPGAVVGGDCVVGEGSHVGIGATVIQGVKIGAGVTVGAGSVVIADVDDGKTVVGVPARPLSASRSST